ncbi:uncharacterized protein LOC131996159 [Stomoxys calcitrans]|uniref:uncharacterized protein LOC131996159 n=1 Tax=Stomoxys calcitrans TaxID=35570 RepID=UPI0027E2B817|nr:uncharacterized protein LOC131996159 [Stomoxys calcitrans]
MDEVGSNEKVLSPAEDQCESHFVHHVQTSVDNRFIVSLPFRENPQTLGQSQCLAYHQFISLERRLQKNPEIRTQYVHFMREYEELGHIRKVSTQYVHFMREYEELGHMRKVELDNVIDPKYFIPHHCVLKPDSTTTKLRVVFDASAKTATGLSLNDIMYTGPVVQSDLFSILLRFRLPRFVFTTDIEKKYRQILLDSSNHQYQLIIWREEPAMPN